MSTLTPFGRKMSTEILGAHFTGAYAAINRLEHVLELGTASVTGHAMLVVDDQAAPALHRRIYESTIRGWLESPAPVIRRGGVIVPPGEYTLFAALGAISFHAQQAPGSVITADFTHITNVSALRANVPLLAGRAGGQTLKGGVAASENLTLDSTAHATKGLVLINPAGGNVSVGPGESVATVHVGATTGGTINHILALRAPRTWVATNDGAMLSFITNATLGTHDFGAIVFGSNPATGDGGSGICEMFVGGEASTRNVFSRFLRAERITGAPVGVNNVQLWTNGLERARIDINGRTGFGTPTPTQIVDINGNTMRLRTPRTPASATAPGEVGEICWDANFVYVCVATNTWRRAALAAW